MNSIFNFIRSTCFNNYHQDYKDLSSKDDSGMAQVHTWQLENPIPNTSLPLSAYETGKIADKIIKELHKQVPLTKESIKIIKLHLVDIASTSEVLCQQLIKRISKKFGENLDMLPIKEKLIMTCVVR